MEDWDSQENIYTPKQIEEFYTTIRRRIDFILERKANILGLIASGILSERRLSEANSLLDEYETQYKKLLNEEADFTGKLRGQSLNHNPEETITSGEDLSLG